MAVTPHQAGDGKHDRCERFVCLRWVFFAPSSSSSSSSLVSPRSQIRKTLGPSKGFKSSAGIHRLHFYTKQWILHFQRQGGETSSSFIYPAKAQMLLEASTNHLLASATQVMIQVPHMSGKMGAGD